MVHSNAVPLDDGLPENPLLLPGRLPVKADEFRQACDALGITQRLRSVLWCYTAGQDISDIVRATGHTTLTVRTYLRDLAVKMQCRPGEGRGHYGSRLLMQKRLVAVLEELGVQGPSAG